MFLNYVHFMYISIYILTDEAREKKIGGILNSKGELEKWMFVMRIPEKWGCVDFRDMREKVNQD